MRRFLSSVVSCLCLASPLLAQDPAVPAGALLTIRDRLSLDSAQLARLRELEKLQSAAFAKSQAAFLRAEADVVETTRGDDPAKRRAALEARARLAIDAELARVKWEKESRGVLTANQIGELGTIPRSASRDAMVWRDLVSPVNLTPAPAQVADSGEVRISVTPNTADIYVDGIKIGTGRKFMRLPVGMIAVEFSAVNCERKAVRLEIVKNHATPFHQTLTCTK